MSSTSSEFLDSYKLTQFSTKRICSIQFVKTMKLIQVNYDCPVEFLFFYSFNDSASGL